MSKFSVIQVKVIPGSSKNEVIGPMGMTLKVKVKAKPEKGKANQELVAFLAEFFGIKKADLRIVQGETSHTKIIAFSSGVAEKVEPKIKEIFSSSKE